MSHLKVRWHLWRNGQDETRERLERKKNGIYWSVVISVLQWDNRLHWKKKNSKKKRKKKNKEGWTGSTWDTVWPINRWREKGTIYQVVRMSRVMVIIHSMVRGHRLFFFKCKSHFCLCYFDIRVKVNKDTSIHLNLRNQLHERKTSKCVWCNELSSKKRK